jgi:hypothetical protein
VSTHSSVTRRVNAEDTRGPGPAFPRTGRIDRPGQLSHRGFPLAAERVSRNWVAEAP